MIQCYSCKLYFYNKFHYRLHKCYLGITNNIKGMLNTKEEDIVILEDKNNLDSSCRFCELNIEKNNIDLIQYHIKICVPKIHDVILEQYDNDISEIKKYYEKKLKLQEEQIELLKHGNFSLEELCSKCINKNIDIKYEF